MKPTQNTFTMAFQRLAQDNLTLKRLIEQDYTSQSSMYQYICSFPHYLFSLSFPTTRCRLFYAPNGSKLQDFYKIQNFIPDNIMLNCNQKETKEIFFNKNVAIQEIKKRLQKKKISTIPSFQSLSFFELSQKIKDPLFIYMLWEI